MPIEIWCTCGEGLCGQTDTKDKGIVVEPCSECLKNKYQEGHDEGYEAGELTCEECE